MSTSRLMNNQGRIGGCFELQDEAESGTGLVEHQLIIIIITVIIIIK